MDILYTLKKHFGFLERKEPPTNCYIIHDQGGNLLTSVAPVLYSKAFKVRVLNFISMSHSHAYNPFAYFNDEEDISGWVDLLLKYTDVYPNYESVSTLISAAEFKLINSLCLYLYYEAPPDEQNLSMIMELLRAAKADGDNANAKTDLDRLFDMLREKNPVHISVLEYEAFKNMIVTATAKKVKAASIREKLEITKHFSMKNVIASAYKRLEIFDGRDFGAITITDNINLKSFTHDKVALFIETPQNDQKLNFVTISLLAQLFDEIESAGREGSSYYNVAFVDKPDGLLHSIVRELLAAPEDSAGNTLSSVKLLNVSEFEKEISKYEKKLTKNGTIQSFNIEDMVFTPYGMLDDFFREFDSSG